MHILYLSYFIIFLEYNMGFPGDTKISLQTIRNEVQIFQQIPEKVYLKIDNQIRPPLLSKMPKLQMNWSIESKILKK